ncbi:MAG: hypothetical protein N2376_00770 [Clostridia bacterium]|nr:hypothetical protein [Clostridia bacterium]
MSQAMRNYRYKRKAAGKCGRCGKPHKTGDMLCEACRIYLSGLPRKKKDTAIRELKRWNVTNHALYNWMMQNKITVGMLAEMVHVSGRAVERWIFERAVPREPVRAAVEKLIGMEVF